ncbi:hypothetical protein EON65_32470 [archaeon]|nr:MAG: hypothetical protein EON65_32470 [archaeon]
MTFLLTVAFIALATASNSVWTSDPDFLSYLSPGCDFPTVDVHHLSVLTDSSPTHPVILRNLTTSWQAFSLWQKQALIDAYGDRLVRAGSESSIVYSAGHAEINIHLKDLLLGMYMYMYSLSCMKYSLSDLLPGILLFRSGTSQQYCPIPLRHHHPRCCARPQGALRSARCIHSLG